MDLSFVRIAVIFLMVFTTQQLHAQVVTFADSFKDNSRNWPFVGDAGQYSISISDGHLLINATNTAIHTFLNIGTTEETDFALHTRMMFLEGDQTGWMGMRFAMNTEVSKYCVFTYNNDKRFMIAISNGKKYDILREFVSQVVKPYDYNTLTVVKKGSLYKFLINDKQVFESKIKVFYGPMISLITNSNMKIKIDEFQVYDPAKGRQTLTDDNSLKMMQSVTDHVSIENLISSSADLPPDFNEFLLKFNDVAFPYYFKPETAQGADVTDLSFTQKTFYQHVASSVSNKTMWALGKLSECGDGYALLMMNRYFINRQDVSRFIVVAFDKKGNIISEKEVGAMVKESGSFFKVVDFKSYRDGNVINVEATETFHNGRRESRSVRFNTALCNF